MNLIKRAQLLSKLPQKQLDLYETIKTSFGFVDIFEALEHAKNIPTEEDYSRWLEVIEVVAQETEQDLTNSTIFHDIAWAMLDDDPMMDLIGNNEEIKRHLVNTLWHSYQAKRERNLAASSQGGAEENEETSNKKPSPDVALMDQVHGSPSLQKVYRSGLSAGQQDAANPDSKPCKSEYEPGCVRDKVWKLGHKHGCVGKD